MTAATGVSNKQRATARHTHPLLAVMSWEARRLLASRSTWVMLALAAGLFLFGIWSLKAPASTGFNSNGKNVFFYVSVTSAEGLVTVLSFLSFFLALILPFVNADGATRDLKARTHELLMSTPLPSWAYIWGRYLVCLLLSLGLALLLLAALLLMGVMLHYTEPDYPLPRPAVVVSIWAVGKRPTAVLIGSASFALGTLLQRRSNRVKMAMPLIWFLCAQILPFIIQFIPSWYLSWEPTNIGMALLLQGPYSAGDQTILQSAAFGGSDSAILSALANLEQQIPDLGPWVPPHLVWVGLSLLLVVLASFTFRRFRSAFTA